MLAGKRILLVVSGGIAAFKALELVRRLREQGAAVTAVLTKNGAEFVTPLSLASLTENKVYQELFSLTDESEMGHIQLSRAADLVLVVPATANILAKLAGGLADDLASTLLLATDKGVMVAPAMNVRMWEHPATQANLATLRQRGLRVVGPDEGPMACGEFGFGRLAEPAAILAAVEAYFGAATPLAASPLPPPTLAGRRALVTSGPTHEPIDPVRYIANRSSGKQGHAIAAALARLGARVTLVTGPVALADPPGVTTVHVETAAEMLDASLAALPAEIAVCAAAVADWRVAQAAGQKLKKDGKGPPTLAMAENPDILRTLSTRQGDRPALVVGFAAETQHVVDHARAKLRKKGCDWILANDVSGGAVFGQDDNQITLVDARGAEPWPPLDKQAVAERLAERIAAHLAEAT
jgi:phosphopantothenoylcysteine decarboxylase/phosphopantothenate--cysteine ligase